MDEVSAILARNYGLRQPGKSAPMAASKSVPAAGAKLGSRSTVTTEPLPSWNIPGPEQRSSSVGDPFLEDLGLGIPRGKSQPAYDDIFGGAPSYSNSQSSFGKSASSSSMSAFDSVFDGLGESGHMSSSLPVHDKPAFVGVDMFDAVLSSKSTAAKYDDVFFSFSSESNIASSTPLYPDPFVNLGNPISHTESLNEVKSTKEKGKNFSGTDQLIPGFGVSSPSNRNRSETNQQKPSGLSTKLTANVVGDPFDFLETKDSNDIESFFTVGGAQARNVYQQWVNMETMFDVQPQDNNGHHGTKRTSSSSTIMRSSSTSGHDGTNGTKRTSSSSTIMKSSSTNNIFHDLFGDPPPSEEFHEIEGESEERRAARFKRHQETIGRVAKALAAKNERDAQIEQEQAERRNIAEVLDGNIKRWAAGKEGNLRALLASLQHVLWSDSGWQSVALTDLITAAAVKKVYRKATLCIHPDKMQQKGATLEQKYISEKVFDLLKEAWKKFSSEELL